jgi:prepilin-type N-terminal cleavage/methylation domain-containing protein
MITTTLSPARNLPATARRNRAFTLVEVMVSATIASFILAAVITTFLFMGRSGANVQHYSDMEGQARKALEVFAQDVRQASAIAWTSNQNVLLKVNGIDIRYSYASGVFTRTNTSNGVAVNLMTGVSTFEFLAYKISDPVNPLPLVTATDLTNAGKQTKQLQISLEARRQSTTVVAATNTVLSARFILRNKKVTA